MKNTFLLLLYVVLLSACGTVPHTEIYPQSSGRPGQILYVQPVEDNTPDGGIAPDALKLLRTDLVQSLTASGHFKAVTDAAPADATDVTFIRCRVTQFSTAARRMVVVSELSSGNNPPFVRMVVHTDLISVAWPIDYIGAMSQAGSAVVRELTAQIAALSAAPDSNTSGK